MADIIRRQYDQIHSVYSQLSDASGPLDIPVGTIVSFTGHMLGAHSKLVTAGIVEPTIGGNGVVVRAGATTDDPNRGFVRYDLSTEDVATPGIYYCHWILQPPNTSQVQSFPEDSALTMIILASA